MYTIDKNIPLPTYRGLKPKGPLRLTMEQMEVGDSFVVEAISKRGSAYGTARAMGIKIRTMVEVNSLRIWRIK